MRKVGIKAMFFSDTACGSTMRGAVQKLYFASLLLLILNVSPPTAQATVIFEQLPDYVLDPSATTRFTSSTVDALGNTPGVRTADDFLVDVDAVITDIHWWGISGAGTDDFTFTFYADAGAEPGIALQTTTGSLDVETDPLDANFGTNIYWSVLDTPFEATAGVTYWLSIFNSAPDAIWLWTASPLSGTPGVQTLEPPGDDWSAIGENLAFQLTIPEPTTPSLIIIGLAVLAWQYKKRHPQSFSSSGKTVNLT